MPGEETNFFLEILMADKGKVIDHSMTKEKIVTKFEKGHVLTQTAEGITFKYP